MISGVWSVKWFDEIIEMVPDITFVLPVKWANNDVLKAFVNNHKYKILWLENKNIFDCIGVSSACFSASVFLGFKKIYFTGFDGTGLPHELLKSSNSHFYGKSEEDKLKTTKEYVRDLYMFSRQLSDLNRLALKYEKEKVKIINLTNGGILDMFERMEFNDFIIEK
jgi:hypothetical protein